jgi:hypothetical protein
MRIHGPWHERMRRTKYNCRLPGGVKLIKLHGSANWRSENGTTRALPASEMQEVLSGQWPYEEVLFRRFPYRANSVEELPAVIFGGKNKLTAEGPFLDLFYQFRDAIRERTELIVIGYSFRDDHVNHVVSSWLRGEKLVSFFKVDFSRMSKSTSAARNGSRPCSHSAE